MSTPLSPPLKDKPAQKPNKLKGLFLGMGALIKKKPIIGYILGIIALLWIGNTSYQAWQNYHFVTLYGNVDIRETNIGFRVSGKLKELYKDEGDSVKTGDLLAILDPIPAQHDLDEAEANLKIQEAVMENADANFKRAQTLVGTRGISQEEFDTFKATFDQAEANVDLMKAREAAAQTALDDTKLVSPADGVIITRTQEAGTILEPGSTVFTISLQNPVWVRAYIEEGRESKASYGREVEVTSDSFPGKIFHGKVGYVSPKAEFTPKSVESQELRTALVYRIRITITDPDSGLLQGMPVTVKIRLH